MKSANEVVVRVANKRYTASKGMINILESFKIIWFQRPPVFISSLVLWTETTQKAEKISWKQNWKRSTNLRNRLNELQKRRYPKTIFSKNIEIALNCWKSTLDLFYSFGKKKLNKTYFQSISFFFGLSSWITNFTFTIFKFKKNTLMIRCSSSGKYHYFNYPQHQPDPHFN